MAKGSGGDFKARVKLEGDKEFKGALGDIRSRMALVKSELALADAEFKANDKSVTALTGRYEALEKQYDLQREKMGLVAEQMEKAKKAYGEGSEQVRYYESQLNDANTAVTKTEGLMRDTAAAVSKAEEAQRKENAVTKLATSAKEALTTALGATADAMRVGLVAAATAAGAAIGALAAATGVAIKQGFDLTAAAAGNVDTLMTLSAQTSVSAETLQKWDYAARFIDTDVSTMTDSMAKMVKGMGDANKGSTTAQAKFKALGVDIRDKVTGELRDSEDVFADAIDALGRVSNETERDALAMDLFGKSAQDLNPLIKAGGDQLRKLGDEAEAAGLVMGSDALNALGGFDDAMQRLSATGDGLKNVLAVGLTPVFQPLVDMATGAMGQVSAALADGLQPGELDGILQNVLGTMSTAIGSVSQLLTDAMPVISAALTGIIGMVVEMLPGLLDTLLPAALGLLQGVIDAIVQNIEPLTALAVSLLKQLATFLTENVGQLLGAATDIMLGLVDGITDALPELIPMAVTMLANFALALVGAIPEIAARLPEIVQAIWDGLAAVDWLGLGTNLIQGLVDGLGAAVSALLSSITGIFGNIWQEILKVFGIASPSTEAASAAGFILDGLLEGFESAVTAVVDAVKRIFGKIWDAIKSIFGFGSGESEESKEAKSAGQDIMTGMQKGIAGGEDDVKEAARNVSKAVLGELRKQLGIPEGGGDADEGRPIGASVSTGVAAGLNRESETAFTGAAYNTAYYIATALNSQMGIEGTAFGAAGNPASKYEYVGESICAGMAKGIAGGTSKVTQAARAMASAAYQAAKTELGIKSPSTRFAWLAEMSAEGWQQGMQARIGSMRDSVRAMTQEVAGGAAAGGGAQEAGIDYDRLGSAVADAMEARGLGETAMIVDGTMLGGTPGVSGGVSQALRRKANSSVRGRSAMLVVTV